MTGNITEYFFHSYGTVLGSDVFWTVIFLFIGIAIFVHSNHNFSITIAFLLITQGLIAVMFVSTFSLAILVFLALMAAVYGYNTFYKKRY